MIIIMKLPYPPSRSVSLLLLVVAWGSGVKSRLCPSGQITHIDGKEVKCCLPVDCEPDHRLVYCERNGTVDTCVHCPADYGLFKRTSSFAFQPCHQVHVKSLGSRVCEIQSVNPTKQDIEDKKNCHCNLEEGIYYKEPQVPLGRTSFCQPFAAFCNPGYQPTQKGVCEHCPPNTVQNNKTFKLCRPQKNCTALNLETKIPGNAEKESVCAEPPPLPPIPPVHDASSTLSASQPPKQTTSIPVTVRPSVSSESDAPLIVVVAVVCSVLLVCLVLLVIFGHRRGWFTCIWKGKCQHQDVERLNGEGSLMQLSNRDNDNTSNSSCYTCADSCLTSSNKSSTNAAGKSAASGSEQAKSSRPLPMLEAYMNMGGKCTQSLSSNGSLSEPFYNSISQDERLKVSRDNMPSYKNTNGFTPLALREDLHTNPGRVHLIRKEEDESLKSNLYAQVQQRAVNVKEGKEQEDFTETDPLLPSSENCSSGVPTPVSTPALRGILRNGNNRQDPKRGAAGTHAAGTGAANTSSGNRPHLSILLNLTDDTSHLVAEESQAANLPHLSQLVSAQRSMQTPGQQPPPQLQHQQLLQQQAPQPQQQGSDVRPQMLQQDSPLAARLIPATLQPPLDPSLVQMEELKPVLPLSPGPLPGTTPSPTGSSGAGPQDKERTGSPACISPTQEEVRGNGHPGMGIQRPGLIDGAAGDGVKKDTNVKVLTEQGQKTAKPESDEGTAKKVVSEQTLRKQADLNTPPGSEETMQKSVCGSSGLGDSLDFSSPLDLPAEEDGRSRTMYRRSNSEASRSVSPPHQLPPSRSISTPEEKHRPFAVVKPIQSGDQSLDASQDRLTELTQPLDAAGRLFPLTSLYGHSAERQSSQEGSGESEGTGPKTPDNVTEEEENDSADGGRQETNEEKTQVSFCGDSDQEQDAQGAGGQDKGSNGSSEG